MILNKRSCTEREEWGEGGENGPNHCTRGRRRRRRKRGGGKKREGQEEVNKK